VAFALRAPEQLLILQKGNGVADSGGTFRQTPGKGVD
jgi:hypothetical protein